MSKLKAVQPKNASPGKPQVLIFGKPGVGKTWTSLDFPNVYYIDTEGGANLDHYTDRLQSSGGVYLGPEQGSLSFETILEQIQALATEKHGYKTLVIDSISKVFNTEVANEAERLSKAKEKNEFGRDKKPAIQYMKRLVAWLNRLDMNVILVAHEKPEWAKGEQIGETFDCWDKLEYELHLCLRIVKMGNTRKAFVRKTRFTGFKDGESFEWSYAEFSARHGKDIIESEAKPVELATEDQIAELKRLHGIVKTPDNWLEKCLQKANAESVEELDSERIIMMINSLKEKQNNG